jgi:hypothetical protein
MSSYVRPRHKFNRQICQDIAVKLGRNQYGLANQEPNNPMYYTLASIKKGISDGAFMKTTITGTKLPNPIKQLKAFASGSSGGGDRNPPAPRIPANANTFVARQNENVAQNNAVRRQARQQLRQQLRGRIAVAQRPNVIRRQVQFQPAPDGDGPAPNNNRPRRVVRGMGKKDAPRVVKGTGRKDVVNTPVKENSGGIEEGSEKAKEVRSFFEGLLKDSKKVSTPATEAQKAGPRRARPGRRRGLVMDSGKKGSPDLDRQYGRVQEQQALNDIIE